MSSPTPISFSGGSQRRRSSVMMAPDDNTGSLIGSFSNGALVSLIRNRSTASLAARGRAITWAMGGQDDGGGSDGHERDLERGASPVLSDRGHGGPFLRLLREDDGEPPRRSVAEERRLSQLIMDPQMRSMRLIGSGSRRYRWGQYWKKQDELAAMSKPLREYYERNNLLIQMYLFIDRLLDSPIPHDMLNEYGDQLEDSAARPLLDVPQTIVEEPPTPVLPGSPGGGGSSSGNGSGSGSPTVVGGNGDSTTSLARKAPRTPREIFTASETTPLLANSRRRDAAAAADDDDDEAAVEEDDEDGHNESNDAKDGDYPRPAIPWLEEPDLDSSDPIVTVAIWVNFAANALLLAGKCVVVAWVPSMSVLASLVDAVLDFLSTAIVYTTTTLIARSERDQYRYPVGRQRLEPLGVLVFSIVMVTSFCQVALECLQRLASPDHAIVELGIPALCIMLGTVIVKGVIWVWYRLVKNSSVRALAEDAKTDVIFNVGSILFPIVGFFARIWWMDALGGLLLSMVVIANWTRTSMVHVRNLTGCAASPDERNLLLYLTMRFATAIKKIQNLRAYHAGDKLFVEVDIVLSATTPLKDSHDLSEVLTYFLESVPIVDRAFVHVDYLTYNVPTHIKQGSAER